MPRERRLSWPAGIALGLLAAFAFLLFLAAHAVESDLLQAGFYKGVLARSNAYERAYNEVALEPALGPEVSSILGGEDLGGLDIPTMLAGEIAPGILQSATEVAIDQIIRFMKDEEELDLRIEITEIVQGLEGASDIFGLVGGAFADDFAFSGEVEAIPAEEVGSYNELRDQTIEIVDTVRDGGPLPAVIPELEEIPDNRRAEMNEILIDRAGLDADEHADAIEAIEEGVDDDEIADAIRASLTAMTGGGGVAEDPGNPAEELPAANPLSGVLDSKYVSSEGSGANTRYYLGPPESIRQDIEGAFDIIHLVSWMSPYGRPIALILLAIALGAIVYLALPDVDSAMRWSGWLLLGSGFVGFVAWLIARDRAKDGLIDATLGDASDVPISFQLIWLDVLDESFSALTDTIWLPCFIAMAVGGVLIAASFLVRPRAPVPQG